MLQVRVLGPVEIRSGEVTVTGTDRQLALIAMLVAARGQALSADRLVEQLWHGDPPPSGLASLQAYVSRLRRVLEPARRPRTAARVLVSTPTGYRLRLDADAVDSWALERALQRAAQLPPTPALATLRAALAGWRGRPFEQFAGEEWARAETARLDELRTSARERVVEALLQLGDAEEAAREAIAVTQEFPLHGNGWRLLALSAWAANRPDQALAILRQHRRNLAEEVGLDPEPALESLEEEIRRRPYEAIVPAQLPRPTTGFIGRIGMLRTLDEQDGTMLAVLTGAGGAGKSALALHWAHRVASRYADGQLYADLNGFGQRDEPADPSEVLGRFLTALGVPADRMPPGHAERVALYRSVLAGRRMLLVLDNARDAEQARPLLPGTPGCAVVVTGRGGLAGLVVAEGATLIRVDPFDRDESRAYLRARLGAAAADLCPAARESVVDRCGGLPLALAVISARAAAFSLIEVAAELVAKPGLDAFTDDLRAVFSWSYRLLPEPAARLFRRLSGQPAVTLADATELHGGDRVATSRTLQLLCDAHLLDEVSPGQFQVPELISAYGSELAAEFEAPPRGLTGALTGDAG